jgi:hypothetical protein
MCRDWSKLCIPRRIAAPFRFRGFLTLYPSPGHEDWREVMPGYSHHSYEAGQGPTSAGAGRAGPGRTGSGRAGSDCGRQPDSLAVGGRLQRLQGSWAGSPPAVQPPRPRPPPPPKVVGAPSFSSSGAPPPARPEARLRPAPVVGWLGRPLS